MSTTEYYIANDYAGLRAGDFEFYYGYEVTLPEDDTAWCFRVKRCGKVVVTWPYRELGLKRESDAWDCGVCLLAGIAKFLEQHPRRMDA